MGAGRAGRDGLNLSRVAPLNTSGEVGGVVYLELPVEDLESEDLESEDWGP
jgi:hypothetical protein